MRRTTRALAGLLLFLVCFGADLAQTPPPPAGAPPQPAPLAPPDCGDPPPDDGDPCTAWVCTTGGWEERQVAAGTSCSDGNACTHTDRCDGAGTCVGQDVSALCASQCRQCNGTATCSTQKAPVGSACSTVPGFDTGCGCTSAGVCAVKSFASGTGAAVTGICWDARGNMRAKYVAPVNTSCRTSCPSP